jgi:type IX secretion system PorP/SprF family membrane protein
MKKHFSIAFLLLIGTFSQLKAQQIFQLTQYMTNDFAYNPAIAGSSDKFMAKFAFRKQWTGVEGAPTTGLISVHGNLSPEKKIGLGAILYTDATGPTRRTGAQLAYAYHLPISLDRTTYLGFGISANLMQYSIKFDDLILDDSGDPQIGSGTSGKFGADANLGAYLKGENYFAGLSANQLFASKYKFAGNAESIQNARHFYLMGGYTFDISESFSLAPAVIGKFVRANKPQFELNTRGIYKLNSNNYWLGVAYRTEDAASILLGLDMGSGFNFAYSYDITTSGLNTVSNGSHEITLGYNFAVLK